MSTRALFARDAQPTVRPAFQAVRASLSTPAWSARAQHDEVPDPMAEALAQARAEGEAAGRAAAQKEFGAAKQRLDVALAEIVGVRERIVAASEEDLVKLAVLIAENLIAGDEAARLRFTRLMATQALELMKQADQITFRIHPTEKAQLSQLLGEIAEGRQTRVIEDLSIPRGGVMVESELGRIDATLRNAIADMSRSLGLHETPNEEKAVSIA